MSMVTEVAAGIVIGYLCMHFLPMLLDISGTLVLAAVAAVGIAILLVFGLEIIAHVEILLAIIGAFVGLAFGSSLLGSAVEKIPFLGQFGADLRKPFSQYQGSSKSERVLGYLFDRAQLGLIGFLLLFAVSGLIQAIVTRLLLN